MKKFNIIIGSVLLGISFTASSIAVHEYKKYSTSSLDKTTIIVSENIQSRAALSRGGNLPVNKEISKTDSVAKPVPSDKVELLDWWKEASAAFPINTVATIKDIYTGKNFKVKRTMGSNHADCEALTIEDTNIIKNIWGGFSWSRRPVHIILDNGRVLAASMSAMPHAGLDSAPAWQTIDNRSSGYGRGQNLDVVKGNGMDGHFDIHFLNSTRHKDGKTDSQHQEAVKIAASK